MPGSRKRKRPPRKPAPAAAALPHATAPAAGSAPATAATRATATAADIRDAREWWLPLGIALLALLTRLHLPDVEDEALPMKKALEMWGWSAGRVSLDPETAGWPSLSFYVHLLLQHLQYALGRITGAFADRNDYFVAAYLDMDSVARWGRALSVIAAGGVVWAGARLAQRLAGREGAMLSALLLAVSPLLLEYSHLITPDILVALFAACAVDRILAINERGRMADYLWAGVWIGLGISSKYTPVLLLPAVFVAHATRPDPRRGARTGWRFDRRPWLTALAAALAFVLTSPYVVLDLRTLARDVAGQTLHMTAGHFGQSAAPGLQHYLVDVLGPALGATGLVACLAGLAWGSAKRGGPWLVLVACLVPYYLGLSALRTQFPRYMLPLLMPLAVGASGLVLAVKGLAWSRAGAPRTALIAVLTGVAIAPAAIASWRGHTEMSRPSTSQLANQFLREAAEHRGPHIAAEVQSISLPSARATASLGPDLLRRLSPRQRAKVIGRASCDVDFLPLYAVQPELSAFYYDLRHLAPYDDIVVSQAVRGRYLADPRRFPVQTRFYQDLDRYGTLVWRAGPERARGPEIWVYRLLPDSAAALLRDRGPLELGKAVAGAGPLHPPDYMRFVEGVARAAMARRDWSMAERYYRLLWEAGARGGLPAGDLQSLGRLLDTLKARVGAARTRG